MRRTLEFKWTVSKARDTYGYNICTLYVDGEKKARCNGGGYDMEGTVLADWAAREFKEKLLKLDKEFYGLSFHDPNYDPGKAEIEGQTVEQREAEGESLGLERYQAHYQASSKVPTERHTVPEIDGATGINSVERILNAIGLRMRCIHSSRNLTIREITDEPEGTA